MTNLTLPGDFQPIPSIPLIAFGATSISDGISFGESTSICFKQTQTMILKIKFEVEDTSLVSLDRHHEQLRVEYVVHKEIATQSKLSPWIGRPPSLLVQSLLSVYRHLQKLKTQQHILQNTKIQKGK